MTIQPSVGPAVGASPVREGPHDRRIVLAGLGVITAAAWGYLVVEARHMSGGMTGYTMGPRMQSMVHLHTWTAPEFGVRLVMWAVMMIAMMVPTAAPTTLVFAAVARKAALQDSPVAPTFVFVAGYAAIWVVFSVVATGVQLGFDRLALLSPTMKSASPVLGGALLIGAGVYELTPLKHACLAHCRAPAHFISQHWRRGSLGAFRMGADLGAYCLGCCWILMGLLFIGGVMNLTWIAVIALFVLLEKTIPKAHSATRMLGVSMILLGALASTGRLGLA